MRTRSATLLAARRGAARRGRGRGRGRGCGRGRGVVRRGVNGAWRLAFTPRARCATPDGAVGTSVAAWRLSLTPRARCATPRVGRPGPGWASCRARERRPWRGHAPPGRWGSAWRASAHRRKVACRARAARGLPSAAREAGAPEPLRVAAVAGARGAFRSPGRRKAPRGPDAPHLRPGAWRVSSTSRKQSATPAGSTSAPARRERGARLVRSSDRRRRAPPGRERGRRESRGPGATSACLPRRSSGRRARSRHAGLSVAPSRTRAISGPVPRPRHPGAPRRRAPRPTAQLGVAPFARPSDARRHAASHRQQPARPRRRAARGARG